MLNQRILWLSMSRTFEIRLDGERVALAQGRYGRMIRHARAAGFDRMFRNTPRYRSAAAMRARLGARVDGWWDERVAKDARERRHVRREKSLAASRLVHRYFAHAWVLMDRDYNSWDNADHIFRYLREREREVNGWFVVRKGTADWDRQRADGYRRIVPYGSLLWKLLVLDATFTVSSHGDGYLCPPLEMSRYGKPQWSSVFLQHGAIHTDISR
ncbi:hypothetical protein [Sanguibacter sp. HDW7]|uniref:hypothetical protein n=1 Tax=Sanguibacter sp. HDW7 TaxID=2714931 RepID=UPI0014083861|nr:hypothetical protein [Sanguibacter sp. HDW7]QIK82870.1 hypothetical protein G7063_03945 [Sanguibacter sp. HDW7]